MAKHLDYRTVQRDLYAAYKAGALDTQQPCKHGECDPRWVKHDAENWRCERCGRIERSVFLPPSKER